MKTFLLELLNASDATLAQRKEVLQAGPERFFAIESVFGKGSYLARWIASASSTTVVPTMLCGSTALNVIPGVVRIECDCRTLPGVSAERLAVAVREHLLQRLGSESQRISIAVDTLTEPTSTDLEDALAGAVRRAVGVVSPSTTVVPYVASGGSDSRFLRDGERVVYGFFPLLADVDRATVHGVDERVSIASLDFASAVIGRLIDDFVVGQQQEASLPTPLA